MWRRIITLMLLMVVSCNVFASTEDDFEPYIVNFVLGSTSLSQELVIYGNINEKGKYYVPFLQFTELMLLPWQENEEGYITGWVFKEDNTVKIDIKQWQAWVGDHHYTLKEGDFINLYGENYISFSALQTILPLALQFDTLAQVLTVETKKPFPIEEQIAREEMLKNGRKTTQKDGILKHVPLELQDYEMLSAPNFDIAYDRVIASQKDNEQRNVSFASRNHLFGSVMNVTGSARDGKLANTQISLQRNDYIKRPFEHPLHPKQYWVGDIITNPANLVSNSAQGVGFTVSNIPPGWKIDFNNLNIVGQSVPNWSIEIYVNNNLFDFSTVNASGVYSFQNIPLNAGLNTVKLVFYGPYGQRREVVEKVILDSKLLQKGKVVYEVSGVKGGRSILETDEQKIANSLTRGDRYYANVRYGLGDKTSLAVGATSYERNFDNISTGNLENNTFLHSSLTATYQSVLLNMDLAHQTNTGGSAVLLSFNTPVFSGSDLFVSSQIFTNDFVSEIRVQNTGETAWRSNNIFRFTTGFNVFGRYISNIYTGNFTTLINGNVTYVQSLRNAVTLFPFLNISNVLNVNQNLDSKFATGVTNVTMRYGSKLLVRGSLGYRPFLGVKAITIGAVNANYNIAAYGLMAGILKDFERGTKSYNVGVNYSNSLFLTSINFAYSKETKAQVMLSFASGVVFSGLKPKITPFNASTTGSVEVNAFLDENQNGIKDFDEKAVEGVGVTITGREMNRVTNNEGTMILTNLPMGTEILFDVNTGIMPDITMKGGQMAKRRMVLLSGATHVVMLPIIQTTEIDGTLVIQHGDTKIPMGNVRIKLIDKENHVVQSTKTSSDGYYIFSEVPHGVYKVKLDDAEVKRYKDYLVEYHD